MKLWYPAAPIGNFGDDLNLWLWPRLLPDQLDDDGRTLLIRTGSGNKLLAAALHSDVALEIDCYPDRSDLKDLHVRMAVEAGVPLVIDTDAHATAHFRFIPLGEAIARRGWATKRDIINARSLKELKTWLEKKRKRPSWTA